MWKFLVELFGRGGAHDAARASYGPEPYRRPEQVAAGERIIAILDGTAKYLLRDVIGSTALKTIPEALVPGRFRAELPVSWHEVHRHVSEHGLPGKCLGGVEIEEESGTWTVTALDLREPHAIAVYTTRTDAQLAVLQLVRARIAPYLSDS